MKILILLFLLPLRVLSQDIAGIWSGSIRTAGNDLPFELVISEDNGKLTGYSLMVFTMKGSENIGIKAVRLKNKKGGISLEDGDLIYSNYNSPPKRIKLFGELTLYPGDSVSALSGPFRTKSMDFRAEANNEVTGTIALVKRNDTEKTRLIQLLGQLNLLNSLSFLQANGHPAVASRSTQPPEKETRAVKIKETAPVSQSKPLDQSGAANIQLPQIKSEKAQVEEILTASVQRKTEIVRSVFFRSDSLVLSLYDNGEVDGDTVSVVLNGKVIIANQGLSLKPIRVVIHVTPELGDSLLVTMIAENLGTIPPNTGLLIVEDGENRNEIFFTGDMQMSSAVLFRRKR